MSTVVLDNEAGSAALGETADREERSWRGTWARVTAQGRARLAVGLLLVVASYRTSLLTLLEVLQLDTPIAHLALVPLIAAWLAWWARRSPAGPDIHDRQLDWIVGLPLLAVAVAMNHLLPRELSWEYWVWRIDLLSLPLFVAGVVSILFGFRALLKYRIALCFLFLAWPYPYQRLLDRWLGRLTDFTIAAVAWFTERFTLAARSPGSNSLFVVTHGGAPINLNIASACSGANGLVGFMLVGVALMVTVRGQRWRKLTWLALGALLVWAFNVGRILIIFWSARQWGPQVALDGFHPVIGLVVFNIAIVAMLLLMRPFGLHMRRHDDVATAGQAGEQPRALRLPRRPVAGMLAVGVAVGFVGLANGDLRSYDRVASSIGAPQLASFATSRETPAGWELQMSREVEGYERFFGDGSEWVRYTYRPLANGGALRATLPITADVIETSTRAAFSNYGVEQCYTFHGYELGEAEQVDLGNGVTGGIVTWTNAKNEATWTSLYWHWPIRNGDETSYERITLIMQDARGNLFDAPGLPRLTGDELAAASSDEPNPEVDAQRLARQRHLMVEFGRDMVRQRIGDAAADE